MELISEKVSQTIDRAKGRECFTIDSDYVIKDNRLDVGKIVCHNSKVKLDESKLIGDVVWVSGNIEFEVVYISENSNGQIESISDSVLFQEKINAKGVDEEDELRIYLKIEDMTISVINSRKIALRGQVCSEIYSKEENVIEYPMRINDDSIKQLTEETEVLDLVNEIKDVVRIKKEIVLPKTKPNIYKLLYCVADVRNMEYVRRTDAIETTGELVVFIIYQSEEQELCCFESVENFSETVKTDEKDADIDWIRFELSNYQIEAENDYDGEPRQLFVEVSMAMDGKIWKQKTIDVMVDLYALDRQLLPVKKEMEIANIKMKNVSKCRVTSQFEKKQSDKNIFHVCSSFGEVFIENIKNTENGIVVSGVLSVRTIAVVDNDLCSIEKQEEKIPFEQYVELGKMTDNIDIEACGKVDQLQVNLLEAREYEVKAVLSIEVLAMEKESRSIISEVEETESDNKDNLPGLVGYIIQKNERLWDVAKKYNTTIESIMEINDLSSDIIAENDRILIERHNHL